MKRSIDFHEVVIRFSVRADTVANTVDSFPLIKDLLDAKFGVTVDVPAAAFDSEVARSAVAIIARQAIGGNDMNCLNAEEISIEVDGTVMIDE